MHREKRLRVLLRIETSRSSGREFLKGILRYACLKGKWEVESELIGIEQAVSKPPKIQLDGLITRVWNRESADHIISLYPNTIFFPAKCDIPGHCRIYTDQRCIGEMAAQYLLKRGLKNFAFCGYQNLPWSEERKNAFVDYINAKGFSANCLDISHNFRNISYWSRAKNSHLIKWLENLPKPVGIMASNDEIGRHVIGCCRINNIRVPEAIAVIGVDNDQMICELTYPQLSSINLNTEQSGFMAAKMLDKMMLGLTINEAEKAILTEVVGVVERQSTNQLFVDDESIFNALQYIKGNVKKPIQVTDVAEYVCMSRRELLRRFNNHLGVTVFDVIQKERLQLIQKYLLESDLTIAQIAIEFGFSGPEKLSRFFKSIAGISPKQFKAKF